MRDWVHCLFSGVEHVVMSYTVWERWAHLTSR